jgi:histone deacetylase 6
MASGGPGGFGDADYLYAWEKLLVPLAAQFKPELTIISAGFDAAKGDPLGGCSITPQGYAHLTKQACVLCCVSVVYFFFWHCRKALPS